MRPRLTLRALSDLERIASDIQASNPIAARRLGDAILKSFELIALIHMQAVPCLEAAAALASAAFLT